MKKVLFFLNSNFVFKVALISLFFMKSNAFLNNLNIINILTKVIAIWGIGILIYDLITERKYFFNRYFFMFVLFGISYLITIVLNRNIALFANFKDLLWYVISVLIIIHPSGVDNKEQTKNEYDKIMYIFIIFTLIYAIGSLFFLLFNLGGKADFGRWGLYAERLYGLYRSPNYGAIYSVISILGSINLLKHTGERKKFFIFNIIIEFLYIVYSGSNSGKVSLVMTIIVCLSYKYFCNTNIRKKIIGFISIIVSCILVVLSCYAIKDITKVSLNAIYTIINKNTASHIEEIELDRHDTIENGYELGNGRIHNWGVGIMRVYPDYKFFGTSMRAYAQIVKDYDNSPRAQNTNITLENDFVSLLVCTGTVGFVLMCCIIIRILYDLIKLIVKIIKTKQYEMLERIYPALGIVIVVGTTMLFTDAIIFSNSLQACLFWISLGVLINYIDDSKKIEEE